MPSVPQGAPRTASASVPRRALAACLLVALVLLAYLPSLRNGFIWDDDQYVTANRELRTPAGLASIWLEPGSAEHSYGQYYPLVHTLFWLEYHAWGVDPLGYHLVNVLLHALAAVLLWLVLERLAVPGAWLAAALFAVHPVHVESVAWITERKNVLSGALYLGSALAWLKFAGIPTADPDAGRAPAAGRLPRPAGRWKWYAASLALFVAALLSKTVTCTLPVAMLAVLWWKRGRLRWQDAAPLLPFVLAGLGLGLTTAWIERERLGASGPDWDFTLVERLLIASRALCFYAGKLLWPVDLAFIYPRWDIDSGSWWQWLPVAACAAAFAGLWWLRPRLGSGPLVAALCFAATLGPALGFVNVYPMRFSFVADHFQYLASIGLLALLAAAASTCAFRGRTALRGALAAAVLAALGALTWRQLPAYRSQETLWLDTLAKNPACWMARNNLGMQRLQSGRLTEAIADFEAALAINPRHEKAHSNLGTAELQLGHLRESIAHYEAALAIQPSYPEAHNNLGIALGRAGRTDEAIAHFGLALAQQPRYAEARYNLALALLGAGRLAEAIQQGEQALALEPDNAETHNNLGMALVQAGRQADALEHFERALEIVPQHEPAHRNLVNALLLAGRAPEAIARLEAWLAARPDDAARHALLAFALKGTGNVPGAIAQYEAALALQADMPPALIDLARIRATGADPAWRDGAAAVRLAETACRLTGRAQPTWLDTLAAAYAEAGRFAEAAATAQEALALATSTQQASLAAAIRTHLELYRTGQALRESAAPSPTVPPGP